MGLEDGSELNIGWAGQIPLKDEIWRNGKKDKHKDSHFYEQRWSDWGERKAGSKAWAVPKPF